MRAIAKVGLAGVLCVVALGGSWNFVSAQAPPASMYGDLRWRMIGPFRGGRTKAAAGVPSRPGLFYIGVNNGGVWKTTDYGRTWTPIFDDQPTGSIGAIAVAPSDPNIIYVGSGEGLQRPDLSTGDGIYKSTDAGQDLDASWPARRTADSADRRRSERSESALRRGARASVRAERRARHLPLDRRGAHVPEGAVQGREHRRASTSRSIRRTPRYVYAVLWEARQGPWENGVVHRPGSGLFKSTDGGSTWRPLIDGLPTFAEDGLGRIGITVAPSDAAAAVRRRSRRDAAAASIDRTTRGETGRG